MLGGRIVNGLEGSLGLDVDRATGIIYVEGKGVWTTDIIERHFDDLTRLIADMRVGSGIVKVFVDTRAAGIQPTDVEEALRSRIAGIYEEGDRVATLVAVDLSRVSVSPRVSAGDRGLFEDPIAALRWLAQG